MELVEGNEYLRQELEYILISLDRLPKEKIEELMKPEIMLDSEKNNTIFCYRDEGKYKNSYMHYEEGNETDQIYIRIAELSNRGRSYEYIYNLEGEAYIEGRFDLPDDLISELQFVIANRVKPKEDEVEYWGEHE